MQYALLDFLRTSLIPELCSDISAGTARNAHLILVAVAAVRAFPDQFAIVIFHDLDFSIVTADHAEEEIEHLEISEEEAKEAGEGTEETVANEE